MAITQIKGSNIADGTVLEADVADGAVSAVKVATNAITNIKVAAGAAIVTSKLSGAVTGIASHGLAASATTDTTSATNISTGTLALARLHADALVESDTGTAANKILKLDGNAKIPAVDGSLLTNTIYDIAFTAGFDKDMVKEDIAIATYGELVMARAGTFVGEAGYVDTVPTGAILIVDVMKNGTTIYASTKPQFAISATGLTAGVLTVTTFAVNDRITFKVTQRGSSAVGQGVRFTLKGKV